MELSEQRQTLNMKAFILTNAQVDVWQFKLTNSIDMFIGTSIPPFMFQSHIFVISFTLADFIDCYAILITLQLNVKNIQRSAFCCRLCWMPLHIFGFPYTPSQMPSLSSIKTYDLTQDGRGGQAEPRGHNRGCIWGVRYWEGHLHFSLCVFSDSDTISCSVWRAFDCELGTEM